jgi:antibiotic biosynthesis monooxygenase (ABM) superfamily enzyme
MMTNLNATSVVDPVKIILERHVHPGAESAFQAWAERYVAAARRFPNHQGSSVLSTPSGGSNFILLRFGSSEDLDAWQRSAEATALLREADAVSAAGPSSQVRSGLETWFTLPGMPVPSKPPAQWKMAVLTWAALLPMVIGLAYLFAPFHLPFLLEVMLSTAIPVVMLTWVIMPRATGWFYRWLYPHEAHA